MEREARAMDDPTRYLVVSSYGPRFDLYYDVRTDTYAWKHPASGTLFKRRSMATAVARLLGADCKVAPCKVDKKGVLVKRSIRMPPSR